MNKLYILALIFLLPSVHSNAQDKILFSYDTAGNQVKRELCINCLTGRFIKDVKKISKEDLILSDISDQISYYPNPVKQELYLTWELVNNNTVSSIQVHSLSGQLLQSFQNTDKIKLQTIPFQNYPSGVYAVVLVYSNSEKKTIKIIKQ
jgi:hypothetical protein